MSQIYFTKDFIRFFSSLEKNNNKEWFTANKATYDVHVKQAFETFIKDLLTSIQKVDSSIHMEAKEAIFRINRDIRFSKNGEPYKTYMSAAISAGGKNPGYPGLFIEMSHSRIYLLGGAFHLEKDQLEALRKGIMRNHTAFKNLLKNKQFVKVFKEIQGEKNKVLSEPFKSFQTAEPLIANKQFYYTVTLSKDALLEKNLVKLITDYYSAAKPMNQFLIEQMGL